MYGKKTGSSKWTDEIDTLMCRNWIAGVSATDCAAMIYEKFGVMFTRNAIIGRAKRKGYRTSALANYPCRPSDPNKRKVAPKKRVKRPKSNLQSDAISRHSKALADFRKRQEIIYNDAPKSRNMTLLELPPRGCHYATSPDEATTHLFCGAPQNEGPYCMYHARICYRATARQIENDGAVA